MSDASVLGLGHEKTGAESAQQNVVTQAGHTRLVLRGQAIARNNRPLDNSMTAWCPTNLAPAGTHEKLDMKGRSPRRK